MLHLAKVSKEGKHYEVPIAVAKMSKMVETALVEECDEDCQEIPLYNVRSEVLQKVIEYCTHYKMVEEMNPIVTPFKSPKIEDSVQQWYADFISPLTLDRILLFELVTAANFMDISPLLDLTCFAVAVSIKGKSEEEIRKIFNISNDFTEEENAQVRNENKWCEEA